MLIQVKQDKTNLPKKYTKAYPKVGCNTPMIKGIVAGTIMILM